MTKNLADISTRCSSHHQGKSEVCGSIEGFYSLYVWATVMGAWHLMEVSTSSCVKGNFSTEEQRVHVCELFALLCCGFLGAAPIPCVQVFILNLPHSYTVTNPGTRLQNWIISFLDSAFMKVFQKLLLWFRKLEGIELVIFTSFSIHKERNCLIWDWTHGLPFQVHTV